MFKRIAGCVQESITGCVQESDEFKRSSNVICIQDRGRIC